MMAEAESGLASQTNKIFQSLCGLVNECTSKWRKMERLVEKCCNRKWAVVFNRACLEGD